ncbi:MAG: two-component system response regulator [Myxococcales bacterium]
MTQARMATVLLVEDNPADAELTRISLRDSKIRVDLHHVLDGEEAMAFLRHEPPFDAALHPDLVLLDLNLPRMDGWQVLCEIRKDPRLAHLPVVVLTTSRADEDVLGAYRSHANCFITKPVDVDAFMKIVRSLEEFWFTVVTLPTRA